MFKKATKSQSRARVALLGTSGSGKTYTGLVIAEALANGGNVAVIDSEAGSASKYADRFKFDVCELTTYSPEKYVEAIHAAEQAGYTAILIDSLTHAWSGKDGALEQVDKAVARSRSGNSFTAWREVTPMHNALIDAMVQCKCHLVATMRTKTEYIIEEDAKGKKMPRKIGMAPVQREGLDFEFDIVADMDVDHNFIVTKTRCTQLDQAVIKKPGAEVGKTILAWLTDGTPPAPEPAPVIKPAVAPPTTEPTKPPAKTASDLLAESTSAAAMQSIIDKLLAKKKVTAEHFDVWTPAYKAAIARYQEKGWANQKLDEQLHEIGDALVKIELEQGVDMLLAGVVK